MDLQGIIQGCQQRDKRAERQFFDRLAPKVYAICRRYSVDDFEAKDFLQECFLVLFAQIHRYDAHKGSIEGWTYRLSTNTILQILRKRKRLTIVEPLSDVPDLAEPEDTKHISVEALIEAVRALPDGYREILNLYIFENWSHADIAKAMGISESTSRSQLTRAKKWLKKTLQTFIPDRHAEEWV